MNRIISAEFITSAANLKGCPETGLSEIALIGRSNVGKSSFINALVNRKKLAKTSNTPGKTRLINFFNINNEFVITDLPGYGFAKVSKKEQETWAKILEEYMLERKPLAGVIQFIDARHEIQKNDLQMREWLNFQGITTITVATKIDIVSKNEAAKSIQQISKALEAEVLGFSAKTCDGKDKILASIRKLISVPFLESQS